MQIEILYCGVCHSDLHYSRDEWHGVMPTVYPWRARPRDRRPRHQGRLRGHEIQINEAYERMAKGDVKYRFSIDMASLKSEQPETAAR